PALAQTLGELAVPPQARVVRRAAARRLHPRPGDREAVALDAVRGHEVEVLAPAVVVVARHVAGLAAGDSARGVGEAVPDRLAPAVLGHGPLDLVRRGRDAEERTGRPGHAGLLRRRGGRTRRGPRRPHYGIRRAPAAVRRRPRAGGRAACRSTARAR